MLPSVIVGSCSCNAVPSKVCGVGFAVKVAQVMGVFGLVTQLCSLGQSGIWLGEL